MADQPNGVTDLQGSSGSETSRTRQRRGFVLIGIAGLPVLLGSIGVLYTGSLVLLNNLEHPFVFGCLAAAIFGVGFSQLDDKPWLTTLIAVLSLVVAVGWAMLGVMWTAIVDTDQVDSAEAPGGHDYEAVVHEGADVIDTAWWVSVKQHRGLASREWEVDGCISDDFGNTYEDVSWRHGRLIFHTTARDFAIRVDPQSGKPQSRIPADWSAC